MRLWTLHPRFLDRVGLVAAWREALLAQKVLEGATRGYRHHPQLIRFRSHDEPMRAIGSYLGGLADEAARRGYRFDRSKILTPGDCGRIVCSDGQLAYEWQHLIAKLRTRDPERHRSLRDALPEPHPLFEVRPGPVATWEVITGASKP